LQLLENQFTLGLLLLIFRKILGVFQFGDGHHLKGHVMIDALNIIINACREVFVDGFTDLQQ